MENLFVLFKETRMVGVYTSHRKAAQTMILDIIRDNLTLDGYMLDCDVEFFSYIDSAGHTSHWEIQEVTPDARA